MKCLKTLTSSSGQTLKQYSETGDCGKCRDQCILLMAPDNYEALTLPEQCGMCTYEDTAVKEFKTAGPFYLNGLYDAVTCKSRPRSFASCCIFADASSC